MDTDPNHRANKIMRFFFTPSIQEGKLRTLNEYLSEHEDNPFPFFEVKHTLRMLENAKLLESFNGGRYFTPFYKEDAEEYGTYVFAVEGFKAILDHFSQSVFCIEVKKKNEHYSEGELDVGSGFLLGLDTTIATAKHVIWNMEWIKIYDSNSNILKAKGVFIHNTLDLALIALESHVCSKPFQLTSDGASTLDDVITMGYPPIAQFESPLICAKTEISCRIPMKVSSGTLVGIDKKIFKDSPEVLLLNTRVKGGNSGGPVINRMGRVVGIITEMPMDLRGEKYDELGYGIAIPTHYLLDMDFKDNKDFSTHLCDNHKNGFTVI